jgi:hypothetical protein
MDAWQCSRKIPAIAPEAAPIAAATACAQGSRQGREQSSASGTRMCACLLACLQAHVRTGVQTCVAACAVCKYACAPMRMCVCRMRAQGCALLVYLQQQRRHLAWVSSHRVQPPTCRLPACLCTHYTMRNLAECACAAIVPRGLHYSEHKPIQRIHAPYAERQAGALHQTCFSVILSSRLSLSIRPATHVRFGLLLPLIEHFHLHEPRPFQRHSCRIHKHVQ